jgi:hypothetical protein
VDICNCDIFWTLLCITSLLIQQEAALWQNINNIVIYFQRLFSKAQELTMFRNIKRNYQYKPSPAGKVARVA